MVSTYNGYAVVVNVCGLVELLLELGVLPVRPDVMLESLACFSGRARQGNTHWTPPGCREVLLTLLEITAAMRSATMCGEQAERRRDGRQCNAMRLERDQVESHTVVNKGRREDWKSTYSCANHHDELGEQIWGL